MGDAATFVSSKNSTFTNSKAIAGNLFQSHLNSFKMHTVSQFSKFTLFLVATFFSLATVQAQGRAMGWRVLAGEKLQYRGEVLLSQNGNYRAFISLMDKLIIQKLNGSNQEWNGFYELSIGCGALEVKNDGNMVATSGNWTTGTGGRGGSRTHLEMQDDGNLVLYNGTWYGGNGDALWATGTCGGVKNGCGETGTR